MFHRIPPQFNKLDDELEGALQVDFNGAIARAREYAIAQGQEFFVVYDDDYIRFLPVSAGLLNDDDAVFYTAYPD
jgi:hypothetical protein